ncbi:MAG TPA: hypothetical protein VFC46_13120, partial [Humisphaera sp.]|nr:hypothetical protein [Humisphaera sp.]
MPTLNIEDAQAQLTQIIRGLNLGEPPVITQDGNPVATLARTRPTTMRLKSLAGMMAAITMLLASVIVAAPADPAAQNLQDRAVLAQLNRPLPAVAFDAVGLSDVVDFLRDVSGANIFVNWKALEAAGVQRSTPISIKARNVAFGTALQLILDSAGGPKAKLTFEMRNGVITISTADALKIDTIRKTYD